MKSRRSIVPTVILIAVIVLIYTLSHSQSLEVPTTIPKSPIHINEGLQETILDVNKEHAIDDNEEQGLEIGHEISESEKKVSQQPEILEDQKPLKIGQDLSGGFTETPFMPKMANETLKAQLGNSAWRLFHTILARYPEKPSESEETTLSQYIRLFAQVYPCGDCARHFQELLNKYPPQTKSRKTAALWGCHVHNKVNERLEKPIYDCTKILEDYDCGCGDDEKEVDLTLGGQAMNDLKGIDIEEETEQLG